MAEDFAALPGAWRRLAEVYDIGALCWRRVGGAGHRDDARFVAGLFGFPPATPVDQSGSPRRRPPGERWTRRFGGKSFVSHLSRKPEDGPGLLRERFGPFSFV